ncbi:YczE/YyaS/YitT family protein [Amycolatopsis vastitatis]|uniref:Membrane protein YczE n=1 Tax=Amycolatopsis vastitatis TaxID=1905142 RepID=A0A229SL14_9PSEU|nr:hypothetical protein [Amycolatopsis vastitatis]OXM59526.1 hypothetical protein CF165_47145 [Amycolatopsis vastitatis]
MAIHVARATPATAIGDHRLIARLGALAVGTAAMGGGISLLVWSRLGMLPMDVLHLGVSHALGWTFGESLIACQFLLALTFIPLRIRLGLATAVALVIPAAVADILLMVLPTTAGPPFRMAAFLIGAPLFCCGIAVYLRAGLGSLPRDGIMLAVAGARDDLSRASPRRTALVRIGLDAAFVAAGAALLGPANALHAGALAPGTVLLALGSGPLIVVFRRLANRIPGLSPAPTQAAPPRGTGCHRRMQPAHTGGGQA